MDTITTITPVGRDLVRSVGEASRAVSYLGAVRDRDISVSALTTMECIGASPSEALFTAADALRYGDTLTLHGLLWARIAGPGADEPWSWRVTLLVSAIDPELGEADSPAHLAAAEDTRVSLYLDTAGTPARALTALRREALTQAGALHLAAETLRERPELEVDALLWARFPARRRDAEFEYRLTILALVESL